MSWILEAVMTVEYQTTIWSLVSVMKCQRWDVDQRPLEIEQTEDAYFETRK